MNDDEVLAAARDSFSDVHMHTPLEQTLRRGRVLRARRRGYRAAALAGAAAIAAAAAVTIANQGTSARTPALAAWTVTIGPDHTVNVTIRQLTDPAGLQSTLRADGIPARVAFVPGMPSTSPPLPEGCSKVSMPFAENMDLESKIISYLPSMDLAFELHPEAFPDGVGIFIAAAPQPGDGSWGMSDLLVQATQSCTG